MVRDIFGRQLKAGQVIIPKNTEALVFLIRNITEMTKITPQGPVDVTTINISCEVNMGVIGHNQIAQCYVVKDAEEAKPQSKLIV